MALVRAGPAAKLTVTRARAVGLISAAKMPAAARIGSSSVTLGVSMASAAIAVSPAIPISIMRLRP